MPGQLKPIIHGRDHLEDGADPITGLLTAPSGTIDEAILATIPGAYYKLNETTGDWADSSGAGRTATYTSRTGTVRGVASDLDEADGSLCVTVDGGPPGPVHAATFVGSTGVADGFFPMPGTHAMSVTARVRPVYLSSTIFSQGICGNIYVTTGSTNKGWGLFIWGVGHHTGSQGRVTFLRDGAAGPTELEASVSLVAGQWTRITATYDGTTCRLYYDNTDVGSLASSIALPAAGGSTENFFIGACGKAEGTGGTWATFSGEIDSVAVWDRALTPSEIGGIADFVGEGAEGTAIVSDGAGGTSWDYPNQRVYLNGT